MVSLQPPIALNADEARFFDLRLAAPRRRAAPLIRLQAGEQLLGGLPAEPAAAPPLQPAMPAAAPARRRSCSRSRSRSPPPWPRRAERLPQPQEFPGDVEHNNAVRGSMFKVQLTWLAWYTLC